MEDLLDRKQQEREQLTEAFAIGYAIAMDAGARAAWNARHATAADPDTESAIARQSATIASLSRLFPGMVKTRKN